MKQRKSDLFIQWAEAGAKLFSTCSKGQYMAILVDPEGVVVSTGYNGTPAGWKHCVDGGCPRAQNDRPAGGDYSDCLSVHAEINAFLHADASRYRNGTLYVNGLPCWDCAKVIVNSGIRHLVYAPGRQPVDYDKIISFLGSSKLTVWECSTSTTA